MTSVLSPTDETELATIVADAAAGQSPLAVVGGGTRTGLGRPVQAAATLTTARLTGVTLYQPSEMVLSARAGTPLAEIEALLAANGQRLAFEPPDYRPVYGTAGEPTLGAVAAANLSGPRRIQAGAARDGLIGLRAVTGRGEAITSGGRVMKNVTGYDLVKFLAGSYGTLAVLTEVTFKVLPSPETEATLVLGGLDDSTAIAALAAALGSPYSVTGAAHLPIAGSETTRTLRTDRRLLRLGRLSLGALARRACPFRQGGPARREDLGRAVGEDPRPRRLRRVVGDAALARIGEGKRGAENCGRRPCRIRLPHPLRLGRSAALDRRRCRPRGRGAGRARRGQGCRGPRGSLPRARWAPRT